MTQHAFAFLTSIVLLLSATGPGGVFLSVLSIGLSDARARSRGRLLLVIGLPVRQTVTFQSSYTRFRALTDESVAFIFGMVSRCQAPISGGERKARRRDLDSGSETFDIENKVFSGPFEPVVRIRFDDVEVTFES